MTHTEREKFIADYLRQAQELRQRAVTEYAQEDNANINFFDTARELNITPEVACLAFAKKHWAGVARYFCHNITDQRDEIEGRVFDLINYLLILLSIHHTAK